MIGGTLSVVLLLIAFVSVEAELFQAPVFQTPTKPLLILETQALDTSIDTLVATDADTSAPNNVVFYTMTGTGDAMTYFYVDANTGDIKVRRPLNTDPTNAETYTLTFIATDRGVPPRNSTEATRIVTVIRNKNGPIFDTSAGSVTINRNVAVDSTVFNLTAHDADPTNFNIVKYQIIGDNTSPTFFKLQSETSGVILVMSSLDTDTGYVYPIRVRAYDDGVPSRSATAVVTINVQRNLVAPVFNPPIKAVTIPETQAVGTVIETMPVTDADPSAPENSIVWTITGDGNATQYFGVNMNGGVYLRQSLTGDPTKPPAYTVRLQANDRGAPSLASAVAGILTVNVTRNNFPPTFTNPTFDVTVPEIVTASQLVFTLSATDQDTMSPYNSLKFRLLGDLTAANYFTVDVATGAVTARQDLNTANIDPFELYVEVSDGGSPSLSEQRLLTIHVNHNLAAPVWTVPAQAPYQINVNIDENRAYTDVVSNVAATDADTFAPFKTVNYEMIGDASAMNYFYVDANNGNIWLKASLATDVSKPPSYTLTLRARDGGTPAVYAAQNVTVVVNVNRNRFAPYFVGGPYAVVINRTNAVGATPLATVVGKDDDLAPFNTVRYTLIGDGTAANYFQVNAQTGDVTQIASVDDDTATSYTVRVLTQDSGTPSLTNTTTVTITVNRNLNRPIFDQTVFAASILSAASLGVSVAAVHATDLDKQSPYNVVVYDIVGDVRAQQFFYVDATTGVMTLKSSILNEVDTNYTINVRACDRVAPPQQLCSLTNAVVAVNVTRNTQPPAFTNTSYLVTAPETSPVGSSLITVAAVDPDNTVVTYRLIGDGNGPSFFTLDPANPGRINVADDLKKETALNYYLRVLAADGGSPSLSATAMVTVTVNRNLNDPVWTAAMYAQNIPETLGVGVEILRVTATDADFRAPWNVTVFAMAASSTARALEYFQIDPLTGAISQRKSVMLDPIKDQPYIFGVTVRDDGRPVSRTQTQQATVTIGVTRNMNAPNITNLPATVTLSRDANVQTTRVIQVTATDADTTSPFRDVTYSIIGDDSAPVQFGIDGRTGLVNLTRAIPGTPNMYMVRVRATDGGSPARYDEKLLTVNITQNLNGPGFGQTNYTAEVLETAAPGTSVLTVAATETGPTPDPAPYNIDYYRVINDSYFGVDMNSGQIYVKQSVNGRSEISYEFIVEAYDLGVPPKTAQVPVAISVNRNLSPPLFNPDNPSVNIIRDQVALATILTVDTTDADKAPFNSVTYNIIGDGSAINFFSIDNTGRITLKQTVQNADDTQFKIRVLAMDSGVPPKSSTTLVTVNVNRNLQAPSFPVTSYSVTILEILDVGSVVLTAYANDTDLQSPYNTITYSMTGDSMVQTYFLINPSTGAVVVRSSLTGQRTVNQFQINVTSRDGGGLAATNQAAVTINIIRSTAPVFVNLQTYFISMPLNRVPGLNVVKTEIQDNDIAPMNQHTVSIIGDGIAPTFFSVNNSGLIILSPTANIDTVTDRLFIVRVLARDVAVPSLTSTATVVVTAVRNLFAPQFTTPPFVQAINYNDPPGRSIYTVTATDADKPFPPNGDITYSLAGTPNGTDYFFIDPKTGFITLRSSVNVPAMADINQFTLQVIATDGGTPPLNAVTNGTLTIVRDEGTLAFAVPNNTFPVTESAAVDSLVASVLSTPQDAVTYSLTGFSSGPTFFKINSTSGAIQVKTSLRADPGLLNQYILEVRAMRQFHVNLQTATATVTINVSRNLNAPVFTNATFTASVSERLALGSVVVAVKATDGDNDQITYSMVNGTPADNFFFIIPATGQIWLKQSLFRTNSPNQFVFGVTVRDDGRPVSRTQTQQATVTIGVTRNMNAPIITNLPATVSLSRDANVQTTMVVQVTATDNDNTSPFRDVTYSIVGDDSAPVQFDIDSRTGLINLTRAIPSTPNMYMVRVRATNGGSPAQYDEKLVTVNITQNLNGPAFTATEYSRVIQETTTPGASVLTVFATECGTTADPPPYNFTYYRLTHDYFWINQTSGRIYLKQSLNGISGQLYMYVEAYDLGVPSKTAQVVVWVRVDRN